MTKLIKRIRKQWRRAVEWLRWKFTKRRRVVGYDVGEDFDTWCLVEYDARKKTYTVIQEGTIPRTEKP